VRANALLLKTDQGELFEMSSHNTSAKGTDATVTIRVSGKLFRGHLSYLEQLVQSAAECQLWPLLSLSSLEELDRAALFYLMRGDKHDFAIISCPNFVRDWMEHERTRAAA
jgi:hypothetical protein